MSLLESGFVQFLLLALGPVMALFVFYASGNYSQRTEFKETWDDYQDRY